MFAVNHTDNLLPNVEKNLNGFIQPTFAYADRRPGI